METSTTIETIRAEHAAALAELFKAFSDPSRLRIISALVNHELNVSTIAEAVGLTESATSHHLRGLRQMGLVRARKEGRQVFYSLLDEHVKELYQIGIDHVIHG
jgi:DNA-binding transcriptional ArsR family regulator